MVFRSLLLKPPSINQFECPQIVRVKEGPVAESLSDDRDNLTIDDGRGNPIKFSRTG